MYGSDDVTLKRDVNVITIPEGTTTTLPKDEVVTIYQSLGGNFTVMTERGQMLRIAGIDADALGREPEVLETLVEGSDAEAVEKNAWEIMKTIYDPEIPVNIVDLGLVYQCQVKPDQDAQNNVDIVMTLTAPGCGMGPVIQGDVEREVKNLPGVRSVNVEVVLDPPWSRDMMSEAAQLQLGMI